MQKSDIHIFDYEGRQILLQIETGSFFEVSRLVAQILRSDENSRREDLVADLSPNHGFEAVVEALSELEAADLISFGPVCPLVDSGDGAVVPPTRSSAETITITLHVSHACNVTCTYCFALGGDYGGEPKLMKWETAKQAVDWLVASTREAGKCQIDFFGGEPLLHLDLVKQTVAYAREHGEANGVEVSFGMTTNGTLLTGDALEFLMQEDIGIMVSIDGPKKVHDAQRSFNNGESTYDIVAANTSEAARRAPEKVLLRTTMTNENLDMKGLVDELEGFKVNSVGVGAAWLSPHHPTAIRNEHLPELRRHIREIADDELRRIKKGEKAETFAPLIKKVMSGQLREYGCGGGKTYFGVDVEGDIYFCSAFGSMPEYKMGDVHNGIDPTVDARFRRDFHVDNKKTCSECWARYLCGGGCAYDARVSTGEPTEPNPVACERVRSLHTRTRDGNGSRAQ